MKSLSRLFGWSTARSARTSAPRRHKPLLDALEDRRMLAVLANFDNGTYVDTGNTTASESDNMLVSLAGMGHSVNPFAGITAGDFAAALSGKSALVIPELEVADLNSALSAAARTTIANFVNSGGAIIVAGSVTNRDTDLVNAIFGFSLVDGGSTGASTRNNAAVAGTQFADSPATLPDNNQTNSVATSSLPAGARALFTRGAETTVAMMPYGSGQVIYLGWDWYDAVPAGGQDGGWNIVLNSSTAEPFVFNAVGGSDLTLRRNGVFFQIIDNATNTLLAQSSVFTTARIVINGGANVDDTLLVDHAFGGVIDRPIAFNGGPGGADLLRLRGGNFNTVIHTSTGPDSGTISYDGLMVNFSGLEPVNDSTTALNYIFNATNSAEVINVVNGPTLFGQASTQINSGSATFESVNFQNKTNVTINALDGLDIVNLNNSTSAIGLQNLKIDTGAGNGDIVNVRATASAVTTTVTNSGANNDFVNVGNFGNTQAILGAVFISNPSGFTDLTIDDSSDTTARNLTVSNAFVTGIAPAAINFIANDIGNLTISGGTGGNTFNINSTQGGLGSNVNTINSGSATDTINIIGSGLAGTNNVFGQGGIDFFSLTAAPAAVLNLDGGATTFDTLTVTGGAFTNVVYSAGTVDSGNITYDGALVSFTTLEAVYETTSATNFTFHGTNQADQIFLVNGQPANGQTIQINSGATTFGLVNLNNKTNVIVNGQNRPDTFTLSANLNAVGLSTLTLNGEDATNAGDDNAADIFNINNTLSGVTTTINGGGGDDVTNLAPTSQFLDNLVGPLVVNGQTGNDALVVNDQSNSFNDNYTITSTTVSRPLAGLITYGTVEALTVNGGAGTSSWTISSTMAGAGNSTTINAGDGSDTFNITGNTLGAGSTNSFNGQGGDDIFNVSQPTSGVTLNVDGGAQSSTDTLFVTGGSYGTVTHNANSAAGGNITYDSAKVNFAGLELINDLSSAIAHIFNAPGTSDTINIVDGPVVQANQTYQINSGAGATFTTVNVANRLTLTVNGQNGADNITLNLAVAGASLITVGLYGEDSSNTGDDNAADTINVVATRAGVIYVGSGGGGSDTFNISGSGLAAGSVSGFSGDAGDDTFNLSPPTVGASLSLDGGAQGSVDTLNVTGGSFTNVVHNATSAGGGDINYDSSQVSFAGLELINDQSTATNYTFNAPATSDTINVVNGPVVLGNQTFQINSGAGATFATVNAANRTNLTLNGQNGADNITFNLTAAVASLTTVNLNGEDASNTGDDNAADTISVVATRPNMTLNGTGGGGNDNFNVTGTGLGANSNNSFSGQNGDDTFNVSPPANGATLSVDGGPHSAGDTLIVTGGPFTNMAFNPTSPTSGNLTFDGAAVNYSNIESLNDLTNTTNFTFNGTGGADTINIVDGPVVLGTPTVQINSGISNAFPTFNFANRTNLVINGQNGADTITLNLVNSGASLATIGLHGEDAANVGDDNAADTINVVATRGNSTLTATGGGGNDIFNITGSGLGAGSTNSFSGQNGDDSFNLSPPSSTAAVTIDGGAQGSADTLTTSGGSFTNIVHNANTATGGNITYDGAALTFTGLEVINDLSTATNYTFNAPATSDTINVVDGPIVLATQTVQINSGAGATFTAVNIANRTNVVVSGQNGADTLTLNLVAAGAGITTLGLHGEDSANTDDDNAVDTLNIIATRAGSTVNATGGGGNDTFNVTGTGLGAGSTSNLSGQAGDDQFNISPPPSGATVTVDGGAQTTSDTLTVTGGSFTNVVHNANSATGGNITYDGSALNFNGLELITDLSTATNYTFNAPSTADTINIVDGPVVLANQTLQINSGAGATFTTVNVANRTTLTANGQNGADTITFNLNVAGASLTTIGLHGEDASNTGDDSAADTITVESTRVGTTTSVSGGGGNDTVNLAPTSQSLNSIQGAISLNGDAGTDSLNLYDQATGGNITYTINDTSVSRPGKTITFTSFEVVSTYAGTGNNQFDVTPSSNTEFFVDGNLPAPGTIPGDFLNIAFAGTTGRKLTITSPGAGRWEFSNRKNVRFNSIEKFNYFPVMAVGADAGKTSKPVVQLIDAETKEFGQKILTGLATYRDGVRVATGDLNGDGIPEIVTAPGRNGGGMIKVFDILTGAELTQYRIQAETTKFVDGLNVAVGDVDGDGFNDIVTVPGRGVSNVKVFRNQYATNTADPFTDTPYRAFMAWTKTFIGGSTVAAADITGDGKAEVILGSGSGMAGTIGVYNVSAAATTYKPIRTIVPFGTRFTGGVNVSVGRINADTTPDIIAGAGAAGNSQVSTFNGATGAQLSTFQVYTDKSKTSPVRALGMDFNNDGIVDRIITAQGPDGTTKQIRRFQTNGALVDAIMATDTDFVGYFLG